MLTGRRFLATMRPRITSTRRYPTRHCTLTYDLETLTPGADWRAALDLGLKSSEVFIVVISQAIQSSQYVLTEVGAARAYALESGRMLLVPVIIDDSLPPLALQDIQAIIAPEKDLNDVARQIEHAISSFIGHRAAVDAAASEAAEKIQSNAADYIRVAIDSLAKLESRDRRLGYLWYGLGFASLLLGIGLALWNLAYAGSQPSLSMATLVLVALKALIVISLLGASPSTPFPWGSRMRARL